MARPAGGRPVARPRLPLHLRLPNPPPVFVGRAAEGAALEAAVRRGPVTVVWGLGGFGKTALVLHTLKRAFSARVARTLYVPLRAGDPPGQMRLEIARALAEARGLLEIAWPALAADPDDLDATLLDLAESSRAWVVIDDLHHGDGAWVAELLGRIARYARHSRWIAASRVDPALPDLAGQVVPIGPLGAPELAELAGRWARTADPDRVRFAVKDAGGSPWRLRQLLAGGRIADEAGSLLAGLPERAAALVTLLSVVAGPLPPEAAAALHGPADPEAIAALERRGLVERTPTGLRLHEAARASLEGALDPGRRREIAARAAGVLGASTDPAAQVEAIRLRLAAGEVGSAADLLARRCADLVAAGYAPRLWRCLEEEPDPRLASYRLRCAVELGDRTVLAKVDPPGEDALADRLAWARALLLRGELGAAEQAAESLAAAAAEAGDATVGFEAALLLARSLGNRGEYVRMRSLLDGLRPPDADGSARRDVLVARCLADLGEPRAALALADDLVRRLPVLRPLTRDVVRVGVGVTLFRVGQLHRALDLLRGTVDGPEAAQVYIRRQALSLLAGLAMDAGALEEARSHLARLLPFVQGTLHRSFVAIVDADRRLAAGELAGLQETLEGILAETRAQGLAYNHWQARVLRLRLAILRAEAVVERDEPPPNVPAAPYFLLHRLQACVRRMEPAHAEPIAADHPELKVLARIVGAQAAVAAGDPAAAIPDVAAAAEAARDSGYRLREAEARQTLCDALVVAGRFEEAAEAAEALGALGRAFPSRLVEVEARLVAAVAGAAPDPAVLEEIAALDDVAPVASRRARALLGAPVPLDAIDRLVVGSVVGRAAGWRFVRLDAAADGEPWRPGWGLDAHRRDAWLPGGRRAGLAARPLLWRLLDAIADSGGAATKESLVDRVWDEREYHPLRHDGRLHAAMHKIRRAIEDDPARPRRVVTTADGYAFGRDEPLRALRRREIES